MTIVKKILLKAHVVPNLRYAHFGIYPHGRLYAKLAKIIPCSVGTSLHNVTWNPYVKTSSLFFFLLNLSQAGDLLWPIEGGRNSMPFLSSGFSCSQILGRNPFNKPAQFPRNEETKCKDELAQLRPSQTCQFPALWLLTTNT